LPPSSFDSFGHHPSPSSCSPRTEPNSRWITEPGLPQSQEFSNHSVALASTHMGTTCPPFAACSATAVRNARRSGETRMSSS
jgi:hypothetical protein